MITTNTTNNTCSGSCGCRKQQQQQRWTRRDFLRSVGAAAGLLAAQPWQAMAGPFTRDDFEKLVPADKKLRPEWVQSLTARGQPAVYRGSDLEKIGMPIGGLCAGQVYLGGDGRLWHWDIFNRHVGTGAEHYAKPLLPTATFAQGFALRFSAQGAILDRPLDREHWKEVTFNGEYPLGRVSFADPNYPVSVNLEAFSPFCPLNTDDSSLPATVLEFTVRNVGSTTQEVTLAGWLENAICLNSAASRDGFRRNRIVRRDNLLALECSAEPPATAPQTTRPDIFFEGFERATHGNWTASGAAFGNSPVEISRIPSYQGDVGGKGKRVINSHASAPGTTVEARDSAKGKLSSAPFRIERHYVSFLIGGGAHQGRTCMNLLVEGKVARTATGQNNNRMQPVSWDVRAWEGKSATLQIVDDEAGGWGNVGVDEIVFSDTPTRPVGPLASEPDFGTMALTLFDPRKSDLACSQLSKELPSAACEGAGTEQLVKKPFGEQLVGALGRRLKIRPGASAKVTFLLSWHMPNLKMDRLPGGRYYASRFDSAVSAATYIRKNFEELSRLTRLWHDTWYDSTLPFWFLDRTFLNTSILATSTSHRFADGRFYGWEGVGCCAGTCGHVWQYAHAMARLFPDLERLTREKVDFGLALQPNGAIHFRGEFNDIPAIDAQAGTILRALREHQVSADSAFLQRNWPRIKKAMDWLIAKDADGDGLITGNQHNTLDTDWFGPVAWLSGLYLAALLAAETMALEVEDREYAARCRAIADAGLKKIVSELFDTEYFINKPDPRHLDTINSGTGCEIDQVFGQSWAFQVGLPRVLPEKETLSALRSLWRYNFTPDVGPYRQAYKPGRWYAMPGEAGLLMCTFPRAGWDYDQAKGKGPDWAAGYFNECMNGFEYQVAGHMIWEGMITEGLAVARAVHDRYHPSRRNPWNEVECGDHYARSMASYGVFLAACGFQYHGPRRHIGFAPRLHAGDFKAAFTAAEGWGAYVQKIKQERRGKTRLKTMVAELSIKWGMLALQSISLQLPEGLEPNSVRVLLDEKPLKRQFQVDGTRLTVALANEVALRNKNKLQVQIS